MLKTLLDLKSSITVLREAADLELKLVTERRTPVVFREFYIDSAITLVEQLTQLVPGGKLAIGNVFNVWHRPSSIKMGRQSFLGLYVLTMAGDFPVLQAKTWTELDSRMLRSIPPNWRVEFVDKDEPAFPNYCAEIPLPAGFGPCGLDTAEPGLIRM